MQQFHINPEQIESRMERRFAKRDHAAAMRELIQVARKSAPANLRDAAGISPQMWRSIENAAVDGWVSLSQARAIVSVEATRSAADAVNGQGHYDKLGKYLNKIITAVEKTGSVDPKVIQDHITANGGNVPLKAINLYFLEGTPTDMSERNDVAEEVTELTYEEAIESLGLTESQANILLRKIDEDKTPLTANERQILSRLRKQLS